MIDKYLSIGFRDTLLKEIEQTLLSEGIQPFIRLMEVFNATITVTDLNSDFEVTSNFLTENGLEDNNPFFNEFDINPYALFLDINYLEPHRFVDELQFCTYKLSEYLSGELNKECIVMFENLQIPIALFRNGIMLESFQGFSESFFLEKNWLVKPKLDSLSNS